jgi:hypothetical protein
MGITLRAAAVLPRVISNTLSTVEPSYIFPLQTETLLGAHSGIGKNSNDGGKRVRRSGKVTVFLVGANDSLSVPLSGKTFILGPAGLCPTRRQDSRFTLRRQIG